MLFSFIALLLTGIFCYFSIENAARDFIYSDVSKVPSAKTGLVLGTSKRLANGSDNPYFSHRIQAAYELFSAGKVKRLILSGDNRVNDYNEPKDMKRELMKRGIPDSCLVLDYAGLRTFDSMVRCQDIFGQDTVIVVSQEFHNARAIYIAQHIGLQAYGYNAKNVNSQSQMKIIFREFFSRIKCLMDLYLLNTQPKHLGEKIKI